ncbi:MAG TPA: toll/interleukin-1 receptor domain-containing protein, partial [Niabella sp.]|nr:toll/interleukin-1 receptor domain-containing protein [Niabella sp.]
SKDKKDKYTILKHGNNNDVCTFIARRLELDFLPTEPLEFLEELYLECGSQDILRTIKTRYKARVFISYSSKDIEPVKLIEKRFAEEQIEVIRDEVSSGVGQKIEDFIERIKTVDCVLLVVSENSLQSTWVCKEVVTALQYNKKLAPCYIDKSFLDYQFWENLKLKIKNQVDEIGKKIIVRGTDAVFDLEAEAKDWREFNTNLPTVKNELSRGIAKSIMPENFETGMLQLIQFITGKNV